MKKIHLIIFLFYYLKSINCLNSNDFCSLKQQDVDKCHELYSIKCETKICTKDKNKCGEYRQVITYVKSNREEIEMVKKFKLFNKSIKSCGYTFDSNDICLNGNYCTEKHEA